VRKQGSAVGLQIHNYSNNCSPCSTRLRCFPEERRLRATHVPYRGTCGAVVDGICRREGDRERVRTGSENRSGRRAVNKRPYHPAARRVELCGAESRFVWN
jgi:hypothetical protein